MYPTGRSYLGLTPPMLVTKVFDMTPTTIAHTNVPTTDSLAERVYNAFRAHPKQTFTVGEVLALFPAGSITARQVRGVLNSRFKPEPQRFPHMHHLARGLYVYDPERAERTWVGAPKKRRARQSARPAPKPVVEAKRVADSLAVPALRPVPGAVVMEDEAGNLFVVRAMPV